MFSKELEEVIEAALADGVLTDKEREILHRRAKAEGVDPDELDLIVNGRLAKMKRENDKVAPVPPVPVESNKVGKVMKCPKCGEYYHPGAYKCTFCGHVFQNRQALKSSVQLAEGIQDLVEKGDYEAQLEFIRNFPIPTAKDDILDFMLSLKGKTLTGYDLQLKDAYEAKFKEAVAKAKIIFADDPQVQAAVKEVTKAKWSNLSRDTKTFIVLGGIIAVLYIIMWLGGIF